MRKRLQRAAAIGMAAILCIQNAQFGLTTFADELSDCGFARCHQAYLVNLQYVVRYDKNNVWLPNDMISISRSYYKSFTQSLLINCSMEGNL